MSFYQSHGMYKGYTGTDSGGDLSGKLQWKLVKFHLIDTNISTKLGTVTIVIRIGIGVEAHH